MLHIRECLVCVLILLSVQDFAPNRTCIAPIVVAFLDKIQRILGIMTNILLEEFIIYKSIIFFRKNINTYWYEIMDIEGVRK